MATEEGQVLDIKLGIVGGGNMAKAIVLPLIRKGILNPAKIVVSCKRGSSLLVWQEAGCATTTDNLLVTHCSEVILWAVKPQFFQDAVPEHWNYHIDYDSVFESTTHVSIMAGVPISTIEEILKSKRRPKISPCYDMKVVRVMPNLGCEVGQGVAVYAPGPTAGEVDEKIVRQLLEPTSLVLKCPENQINAYCGLMGSGIGFMFPILEAMSDGAVKMGIPREISLQVAAQTMKGASELYLKTKCHPAALKDRVCSPGGTTIAGVSALEKNGVRFGIIEAIEAATLQGEKLAQRK